LKNIGIIGAGISGLSLAKILNMSPDFNVEILESEEDIGGIAKTKKIDGIPYHLVGGHCFNSKNKEVMDFIFSNVLPEESWHKIERNAKIFFKNNLISYPIEFAIKEIAKFDTEMAYKITKDFLCEQEKEVTNLDEWFRYTFGDSLAEEYFIPYNTKIWNRKPINMSFEWVKDKLPIPNKKDFFESLIAKKIDLMPHSSFYYPKSNDQNSFIEALAKNLCIINNYKVNSIQKIGSKWIVNSDKKYDILISTMPLNELPFLIENIPSIILDEAHKLKYNKVTNMLWKTRAIKNYTWTYYPDKETIFHRHIHIGNFLNPSTNYTITEAIGEHSFNEMLEHGKKFEYLLDPIDYNISNHAYIVYDESYKSATSIIKHYMKKENLFLLGRFGEWEYYNMDICIEKAIELSKIIKGKN